MKKKLKAVYTVEATLTVPMFVMVILCAAMAFKIFSSFSYAQSLSTFTASGLADKLIVYTPCGMNELMCVSVGRTGDGAIPDEKSAEVFYDMITTDFSHSYSTLETQDERYYANAYQSIYDADSYNDAWKTVNGKYSQFYKDNANMDKDDCEEYLRYSFDRLLKEQSGLSRFSSVSVNCKGAKTWMQGDLLMVRFEIEYTLELPFSVFGKESIPSEDTLTISIAARE